MITSYQGGNTSLSNFPFRAPFRIPRCLGWGGRISKGSNFVFILCYYFVQAHFVMFSGLLGPLSIKLLYFTAYFFKKNLDPFLQSNFLWFCLTFGLKN